MTVYFFDNSGSYDCLLQDISFRQLRLLWEFIKGYFFDNSGSYDSLIKDISSITQAHMTCFFSILYESLLQDISSITQAHMTVY